MQPAPVTTEPTVHVPNTTRCYDISRAVLKFSPTPKERKKEKKIILNPPHPPPLNFSSYKFLVAYTQGSHDTSSVGLPPEDGNILLVGGGIRTNHGSLVGIRGAAHKEDRRLMERSSEPEHTMSWIGAWRGEGMKEEAAAEAEGRAINSQNDEGYSRGWPHISPPPFPNPPSASHRLSISLPPFHPLFPQPYAVSAALGVDLPRYGDRGNGGAPLASSMPGTSAFWGAPPPPPSFLPSPLPPSSSSMYVYPRT